MIFFFLLRRPVFPDKIISRVYYNTIYCIETYITATSRNPTRVRATKVRFSNQRRDRLML